MPVEYRTVGVLRTEPHLSLSTIQSFIVVSGISVCLAEVDGANVRTIFGGVDGDVTVSD